MVQFLPSQGMLDRLNTTLICKPCLKLFTFSFPHCGKYYKVISTLWTLPAFLQQSYNYLAVDVLLSAFQIVKNIRPFFPHSGKYTLLFLQCGNSNWAFHIVENIRRCFPHYGNYQRLFHKIILTIQLTLSKFSFGTFLPQFLI